jgi:hypothetical protein
MTPTIGNPIGTRNATAMMFDFHVFSVLSGNPKTC